MGKHKFPTVSTIIGYSYNRFSAVSGYVQLSIGGKFGLYVLFSQVKMVICIYAYAIK